MANEIMILRKDALATPQLEEIRDRVSKLVGAENSIKYAIAYNLAQAENVIVGNSDGFKNYEEFCKVVFGLSKTAAYQHRNVAEFIIAEQEHGHVTRYYDAFNKDPENVVSVSKIIEILPLRKKYTCMEIINMHETGIINMNDSVRAIRVRVKEILNPKADITQEGSVESTKQEKDSPDVGTAKTKEKATGKVETLKLTIPVWYVTENIIPELERVAEECPALHNLLLTFKDAMKAAGGEMTLNVARPENLENAIKAVEG